MGVVGSHFQCYNEVNVLLNESCTFISDVINVATGRRGAPAGSYLHKSIKFNPEIGVSLMCSEFNMHKC